MNYKISYDKPIDENEWNKLALENSNLLQSTYYDSVQEFYKNKSIYFSFYKDNQFVGGIKLNIWFSDKLSFLSKSISKAATQFGEYLITYDYKENVELAKYISETVQKYLKENKYVIFRSGGFYGSENLIIKLDTSKSFNHFEVATIDLTQQEDVLLANMHLKHRNSLKKAQKSGLVFEEINNVESLLDLMKETYQNQEKTNPNLEYISRVYQILSIKKHCQLFAVKKDEKYLSIALIQKFGKIADYTFAGNSKNNLGAGQFLHWNIMIKLKEEGINVYSMGQVAIEKNENNLKFSKGISDFKNRFGTKRQMCYSQTTILKPIHHYFFKFTLKLFSYVSR